MEVISGSRKICKGGIVCFDKGVREKLFQCSGSLQKPPPLQPEKNSWIGFTRFCKAEKKKAEKQFRILTLCGSVRKMKSKEILSTWSDYLSMAERLHMDTHDAIIYRVRKLRQRHDELVEQCRLKELSLQAEDVLEDYPHINQIYAKIKEKYEYADKEYSIVAPNCIEDILQEGQNLHHCLRGSDRYWERIERNESYIFFLRRSDRPEKSYYTLEIEPDIEDATKFLRKWQREISKRLTHRERKLAKTSRILREKEFQEMREKQLVIHTGELSGQLLVDVLTADLLENVQVFESESLQEAA